jgi:UDP-N-acetylmuramate dehydrogenase
VTTTAAVSVHMSALPSGLIIEHDAPIKTWFGCGGRADRLAKAASLDHVIQAVKLDPNLRVLGDGANLLVADSGVRELVLTFTGPMLRHELPPEATTSAAAAEDGDTVLARFPAGAKLPQVITESHRHSLTGLEVLAGIPASLGGAVIMNAGGAFGQIADFVHAIEGIDRQGHHHTISRDQLSFSYRHSNLKIPGLILTHVTLAFTKGDAAAARLKLKECMAYKSKSQPMGASSAGCCFKNPTLAFDIPNLGAAGQRLSAGMIIDRAGCKGLRIGSAHVSTQHANFLLADPGSPAADVFTLINTVRQKVHTIFGITLQTEVVLWP